MKITRNPATIHPPLASYSHQIELLGPQRMLVMSGQIGMGRDGLLPVDPMEQFKLALVNIENNLTAADMQVTDLVKLTIYLAADIDSEIRRVFLSSWLDGHEPAMTLLNVVALATPDIKVELDAFASADYE